MANPIEREIRKGVDKTFLVKKYDQGIPVVPASATFTIWKNGVQIHSGTGSIGTDGTMGFLFPAGKNTEAEENLRLDYSFVVSGNTFQDSFFFDVAISPLENRCDDQTLFTYVPKLRNMSGSYIKGKTSALGSVSTFLATDLRASNDVDWTGGLVRLFLSTGMVTKRATAYDRSTWTVTFDPPESSAIPAGIYFEIRDDYSTPINEAFHEHVIRDIRAKVGLKMEPINGGKASGYIDGGVVRRLTAFKAIEIIASGRIEEKDDVWQIWANDYAKKYEEGMASLLEPYDRNNDGSIDKNEAANPPINSGWDMVR